MRISDWSSDVCSSDLPGLVRIGAALRVPCVDQLGPRSLARLGRVDHAVLLIGMDRLARSARRQRPRCVALPVLIPPANPVAPCRGAIGRTACRVRSMQYVFISLIAASVKQTKIQDTY